MQPFNPIIKPLADLVPSGQGRLMMDRLSPMSPQYEPLIKIHEPYKESTFYKSHIDEPLKKFDLTYNPIKPYKY